MTRRAFTMLEAILALTIISAVVVVCLGLRSQSLRATHRMSAAQNIEQGAQDIYEELIAGLLPDPEVDERTGVRVWRGERVGRPYVLTASVAEVANPLAGSAEVVNPSPKLLMWKYVLEYAGRRTEFYWVR